MAITIGLTGGIGSGKSLAGEIFNSLGAIVIDSDVLAHQAIERGSDGFDKVVAHFGDNILKHGEIDRRTLGELIFANPNEKKFLETVIHPQVFKTYKALVERLKPEQILINQIPLLVEIDAKSRFDITVTINCKVEIRTERLLKKGMYISEINARMKNQKTDEERSKYCDYTLDNNGSQENLELQIHSLWEDSIMPLSREKISFGRYAK